MSQLCAAVSTEWLKIRRSKAFPISIAAMCVLPLVCGLFLVILLHPGMTGGILAQKAQVFGAADWASYLAMLNEMMSVAGVLVFGFITAWTFGREFSDRTAKDLFALPTPRAIIVTAKFVILAIWCLLLALVAAVVAIALGLIIGPSALTATTLLNGVAGFAISALLSALLITPVAFFASFGRGYLLPLGFIIVTILLGQLGETLGIGAFLPWDLPAILAGIAHDVVPLIGYLLFAGVVAAGFIATQLWWRYADQK